MDNVEKEPFDVVLRRARAGDPAAAAVLRARYERNIHLAARRKLPRTLRSKFDSMDFVQAVWTSFFTQGANIPEEFDGEKNFVDYVSGAAKKKVLEQYRRYTKSKKYNINVEEPIFLTRGGTGVFRDVPSADPTASQDFQAQDRYDGMVAGRSDKERRVISLRRQGLTYGEIETQTGINQDAARRIVDACRKRDEMRGSP